MSQSSRLSEDNNSSASEANIDDRRNSDVSSSRSIDSKSHKNNRMSRKSSTDSQSQDIDENKRKKKIFDYELYLDNSQVEALYQKTNENFEYIYQDTGVQKICYDNHLEIPDMPGKLLRIIDKSKSKKFTAASHILRLVQEGSGKKDYVDIIVLIPEGMVSLLIGKQGRQINKIMDDSGAKVVANQPITGMNQRTIGITGTVDQVSRGIDIIFDIMQERSAIVYDIEKIPKQVSVEKLIIKARFVFSHSLKHYLFHYRSRSGKSLLQHIDIQMGTQTQFQQDRHMHPQVSRDELFCTIKGKLEPVQKAMIALFRQINEYYVNERSKPDYKIKMMIPSNYTTKLIGKEGCMIRDLAARAGGAQIKILSHKGDNRDVYECPIEIAGTLQNKEDACCLIIEKIEQFKNGGPILRSAKAINENLVEQYRNSIQDTFSHDTGFKAQLKAIDEEFQRSRTRSPQRRRYSGHYSPKRIDYYRHSRSRSRSKDYYKKDKYNTKDDRRYIERDQRFQDRQYERDKYESRYMDRDDISDKYKRDEREKDRERERMRDRERMRERDRDRSRDRERERERERERDRERDRDREREKDKYQRQKDRNSSDSRSKHSKKWPEEQQSHQRLKIPIIVTTRLVQILSSNNCKIMKQIQESTGCKISIEKEKRLILHGTVESNIGAFKKIQQEFLKLGSD